MEMIRENHRDPFQGVLAEILGSKPSQAELKRFAKQHPDRWAQMVSVFSKLSGYTEKSESTHNYNINIAQASDAELFARLKELSEVIEGEVVEEKKPEGLFDERTITEDGELLPNVPRVNVESHGLDD